MEPAPSLPPRFVRGSGAERNASKPPPRAEQARFITEDVLTGFLRPLFAKSRPTTVTASGRPAAFPEPPPRYAQGDGFGGGEDSIAAAKPWKYTRRYAVTVFEWTVKKADVSSLRWFKPSFDFSNLEMTNIATMLERPHTTALAPIHTYPFDTAR